MRDELIKEKDFLDSVYTTYKTENSPYSMSMKKSVMKTFKPFIKGGSALELGCSDGYMTEMISNLVDNLDVYDGCKLFLDKAKERAIEKNLLNINFNFSLFENIDTTIKYDYVIASYILEHVLDPVEIMKKAYNLLKNDGLLFIVVPNANALSRQLALHMGMYHDTKDLTENDLNHGHRRVYDRVDLNRDIEKAGFINIAQGGLMLKILADFQMNKLIENRILETSQLDGLYTLGLEYPDLCGSLFSIASKIHS
jgi:2-polyprenyl-3-methyl-5-hydroxy-6-metoxy-1,4-benzoquinol methylase